MLESFQFEYYVSIAPGAQVLLTGPYANGMPGCGEIMIASKSFSSYEECEKNLTGLLGTLSIVEASLSDKNFVIVTKANPNLNASSKKQSDADTWDARTLMRAWVADAELLKTKTLKYSAAGYIKVTGAPDEALDLIALHSAQQ